MPSYKDTLSSEELADLLGYLLSLKGPYTMTRRQRPRRVVRGLADLRCCSFRVLWTGDVTASHRRGRGAAELADLLGHLHESAL